MHQLNKTIASKRGQVETVEQKLDIERKEADSCQESIEASDFLDCNESEEKIFADNDECLFVGHLPSLKLIR